VVLIGWSRGNSSSGSVTSMVRDWPGTRLINCRRSSATIIWWTAGAVTRKKRWKSASAGGRRFSSV
jgi:hypothetical protein